MVPAAEAADQEGIGDTDLTEQIVVSVIVKCCFSSPLGEETVEMGKRNTFENAKWYLKVVCES